MKLLVLTQKVDEHDSVLGFFHQWIEELAKHCEGVEVVCLFEGAHHLPNNVRVHSLGKEQGAGKIRRTLRFYRYLWQLRGRYDGVLVHMNPEYLVLAGWWWKLAGVPTLLWYSHRSVDLKLRIAERFVGVIASSAASSFRLQTPKLRVLGHGIDTALFTPSGGSVHTPWRLVSVGRLTPIKRLETVIEALALVRCGIDADLTLVGQAVAPGDLAYAQRLKEQVQRLSLGSHVQFAGAVPYGEMASVYHAADVSVNAAPTGGLDKAVLESMATGLPTLVTNQGFAEYLGQYQGRLLCVQDDAADLAEKLSALYHANDSAAVGAALRQQVVARANLDALITNLLSLLWPNK